jgi:hypothetical protein
MSSNPLGDIVESPTETTPLMGSGSARQTVVEEEKKCCTAPVCAPDVFFSPSRGWMQFWSPFLGFSQLTQRTRYDSFYAFDTFRALAYLWVSADHLSEGLSLVYSDFSVFERSSDWFHSVFDDSYNAVTVFFVISGFLNLYVLLRISESFKVTFVFLLKLYGYFVFHFIFFFLFFLCAGFRDHVLQIYPEFFVAAIHALGSELVLGSGIDDMGYLLQSLRRHHDKFLWGLQRNMVD